MKILVVAVLILAAVTVGQASAQQSPLDALPDDSEILLARLDLAVERFEKLRREREGALNDLASAASYQDYACRRGIRWDCENARFATARYQGEVDILAVKMTRVQVEIAAIQAKLLRLQSPAPKGGSP